MRKIVIIGSTGQLAWDLLRVLGDEAIGLTHQDLEVTDGLTVLRKLQALKPDWVINTSAYNRVDDCEINPGLAFDVNALGAFHVARAAAAVGAGVIHFSTDYVFGGDTMRIGRPYTEQDKTSPLSVYGTSKSAGEELVRQANPRHMVVRTTGLYGLSTSRKGWTFPELMLRKARAGETIRVVADQVLTPTYTADLAAKVKEMMDRELSGLFHVTNAGECSWFEFTRELYRRAGVEAKLEPISTEQSQRRARRPAYSVLAPVNLEAAGLKPVRTWQEALHDYLKENSTIENKASKGFSNADKSLKHGPTSKMTLHFNPLDYPAIFTSPRRLTRFSYWVEHIPFAMFLVDLLKPQLIVELGTHYGDSYCAFCQAIQETGLDARCFAIDTWQGDLHVGPYGAEVLADLRGHHDPLYGDISRLIQSPFDQAVSSFEDGTIDLLHIDGCHTYDAVKHDFDTWLPKMSTKGVVLFHDINVREKDYGVWRLWKEIKPTRPHLEFVHGHGLGVLAVGKTQAQVFQELLDSFQEENHWTPVRNFFYQCGHKLKVQAGLAEQRELAGGQFAMKEGALQELRGQLARALAEIANRDGTIQDLRGQLAAIERERDTAAGQLRADAQACQERMATCAQTAQGLQTQLSAVQADLTARDAIIRGLHTQLAELTAHLEGTREEHQEYQRLMTNYQQILEKMAKPCNGTNRQEQAARNALQKAFDYVWYQDLLRRIRKVVTQTLSPDATLLVTSKGDPQILNVCGRKAWHFPQTEDGTYAGHHPADDAAAIAHLEQLVAKGAEYLLVPSFALWWLEDYPEFGRHVRAKYQPVATDDACVIFDLKPGTNGRPKVRPGVL